MKTEKRYLVKNNGLYLLHGIGGVWGDRWNACRFGEYQGKNFFPKYYPKYEIEEIDVPQDELDMEYSINEMAEELAYLRAEKLETETKLKTLRWERRTDEVEVKPSDPKNADQPKKSHPAWAVLNFWSRS
jgi:hypothetical protein